MFNLKKCLVLITLNLTVSIFSIAQNDTLDITNGKWTLCSNTAEFSTDYKCINGWTTYEFDYSGNFIESQGPLSWQGVYQFSGNSLTLDRDDPKNGEYPEIKYDIIWINSDRFYSIGQEGKKGPVVYTYFERIK
jgi:hypothetical protein